MLRIVEVEPPSPLRYLIGAAIMMIGVVLPVGYMMFRNKPVASASSYSSKQTIGEVIDEDVLQRFAAKAGIDGLLDIARRSFCDTSEVIETARSITDKTERRGSGVGPTGWKIGNCPVNGKP